MGFSITVLFAMICVLNCGLIDFIKISLHPVFRKFYHNYFSVFYANYIP